MYLFHQDMHGLASKPSRQDSVLSLSNCLSQTYFLLLLPSFYSSPLSFPASFRKIANSTPPRSAKSPTNRPNDRSTDWPNDRPHSPKCSTRFTFRYLHYRPSHGSHVLACSMMGSKIRITKWDIGNIDKGFCHSLIII